MRAQTIFNIFLIICQLRFSKSSNILAFFPSAGRSHFKPFEPFFKALAYRGHNVTVVNSFPSHESIPGYHEIAFEKKEIGSLPFAEIRKQNRVRNWMYIFDMVIDYNTKVYTQRKYHEFIKSNHTHFDLLFAEVYHADSFFLLAQKFDCPIIGVSFQPLISSYHWMLKNPLDFSFIPHLYMPFNDHMNFGQRFANSAFNLFTWLFHYAVSLPAYDKQGREMWQFSSSEMAPSAPIPDFERLSMIFVETHFSAGYVRPNLPNVVDVAGIHLQHPKPLPTDIQEFMDASENGVILVSLGTLLRPEDVNDFGTKLLNVLSKLPYNVIWKWKANLIPDSFNNIMIREWLPQSDILNHHKCKLFISHSGYHSVLEAINAGVPILAIPFFTDQYHNAAIIEKFGIGTKISYDANEQDLETIIGGVLNNDEYHKNSQLQSKIFKDRPMSPIDTGIYWTEYVLRYRGAYHLKSAATKLYWFQYLGLDVFFVYIVLLSVLGYSITKTFVKIYSYLSCIQDRSKWRTSNNKLKSS